MPLVLLMQSALETFYQTTLKRQRRPLLQHKTSSSMSPTSQPTGSNSLLFPLQGLLPPQHPLVFPWEESLINSHPRSSGLPELELELGLGPEPGLESELELELDSELELEWLQPPPSLSPLQGPQTGSKSLSSFKW